jgi:hypothetical protein
VTSRDFVYWLQGLFELGDPKTLDENQTNLIKRHLAMVFKHEIDPSMGDAAAQEALNKLHADLENAEPDSDPRPVGPRPSHDGRGRIYRC